MAADETGKPKSRKGFASMSPEKRRQIASMGGKSVPTEKRSFSRNHNLAAAAGRKGGSTVRPDTRAFSMDRELAREAGRVGGSSTGAAKPLPQAHHFLHVHTGGKHIIVVDDSPSLNLARAQQKIEEALAASGITLDPEWRVDVTNRDGDVLLSIRDKRGVPLSTSA